MTVGKSTSKRKDMMRERRQKAQQRQRLLVVGVVVVLALALIAVFALPNAVAAWREANTPVGQINPITPMPRPNAKGTSAGDPNAPVKVDVYEDFQCPACRSYTLSVEKQVMDTYVAPGKIYYTFHNFPFLDQNSATKESHQAANAAMCAADQGRFWDYHDILFENWNKENEGAFLDKRLVAFGQTLGLDMNKFNTCFKANTFKDKIEADYQSGVSLGVSGTPSVFVDGKEVKPGYIPTFDDMKASIDAALSGR